MYHESLRSQDGAYRSNYQLPSPRSRRLHFSTARAGLRRLRPPSLQRIVGVRIRPMSDAVMGALLWSAVFSIFDRLFFTFTPSSRGLSIPYGLDGLDDSAAQTTAGLLAMPFQD